MPDHGPPAISVKPVLAVLAVVIVVLFLAMTALYFFYKSYPQTAPPEAQTRNLLTPLNAAALDRTQEDKRQHLKQYGWISRDGHIIHIPIDQAIEIVARQSARSTDKAPDSGGRR